VSGSTYRFVAAAGDARERLDKFVVMRLEGAGAKSSRAAVQRWVRAGNVTLDGRRPSPSDRVGAGAVVEVTPMPPETTDLEPDAGVQFEVLFEDAHLIVIEKPGGLVVHPARGHASGTLVHGLLARGAFARFPRAARGAAEGEDATAFARPGIVHRLDKGTSGVMVVAKDEATREGLKTLFARHDIERAYLAIVVGKIAGPDAFGARLADRTFDTLHGRHPTQRLKFTTQVSSGRRAVTSVRVLERLGADAALVECRLATGRTHQIRVHLSECARTPILGDPIYGRPPRDPFLRGIGEELGRQALHAAVLGFVHPATGDALRFERDPPADFRRALAALRARPPSPPAGGPGGGRASNQAKGSR
jgi:23S rRNA pseudouridine1911/1915/1917 synthase